MESGGSDVSVLLDQTKSPGSNQPDMIDPFTGWGVRFREPNGLETALDHDLMGRVIQVTPMGGTVTREAPTTISYSTAFPASITLTRNSGGELDYSKVTFDGFGRAVEERTKAPTTLSGTTPQVNEIVRNTVYDGEGRVKSISTWGAGGLTEFKNPDAFGRPTLLTPPDGNAAEIELTYKGDRLVETRTKVGNPVLTAVTRQYSDRFGRIFKVEEPTGGAKAEYGFDVSDRLRRVDLTSLASIAAPPLITQPTRTFNYDGRGFLTAEQHAEANLVQYQQLDGLGNPLRIDQAGVSSLTLSYDKAARLTGVTELAQGGRELVAYTYAAPGTSTASNLRAGQLTKIESFNYFDDRPDPSAGNALKDYRGLVTEDLEYGQVEGRLSKRTTKIEGQWNAVNATTWAAVPKILEAAFDQTAGFDAIGNLISESYPQCTNSALCGTPADFSAFYDYKYGHLTKVLGGVNLAGATAIATSAIYHPSGPVKTLIHAVPSTQPMRFIQTVEFGLSRPSIATVQRGAGGKVQLKQEYGYDGSGNPTQVVRSSVYNDSGTPTQVDTDSFSYDRLSRVVGSTMEGVAQTYVFDAFGNLTRNATSKTTSQIIPADPVLNVVTNRMTGSGVLYDGAGNLTQAPGGVATFGWDRLNRLLNYSASATSKWNFLYTGGGERLRVTDGAWSAGTWTLRSMDGRVLREYSKVGATWQTRDTIWGPNGVLATMGPEGTRHVDVDHLGTPRLIYDTSGNLKDETGATVSVPRKPLMPFGTELKDPLTSLAHASTERHLFTGHERDNVDQGTRLDDVDSMRFRFFSPNYGRFLSVDPVLGSLGSPQSWNLYSYVRGGPLKYVDPLGLIGCAPYGTQGADITCTDRSLDGLGALGEPASGFFGNAAEDPLHGPPQFGERQAARSASKRKCGPGDKVMKALSPISIGVNFPVRIRRLQGVVGNFTLTAKSSGSVKLYIGYGLGLPFGGSTSHSGRLGGASDDNFRAPGTSGSGPSGWTMRVAGSSPIFPQHAFGAAGTLAVDLQDKGPDTASSWSFGAAPSGLLPTASATVGYTFDLLPNNPDTDCE